jgi:glycosyltransferase involved in cell wall biosynthesis
MQETERRVRVTVVIPTLNEVRNLGRALDCVQANGLRRDELEVMVIDGGSRDGTVELARDHADRLPLRVIAEAGCSVYRALNIGLQQARGDFFVRVDARSEIPANYIDGCLRNLDLRGAECVGGIQLQYGETAIGDSIARVTSSIIGTGGARFRTSTESGYVDSVYLGVYRVETLRRLGGFDDRSDYVSEDALVNKRIREGGGRIWLDATMQVRYPAKASFRALVKQYIIYGAAKAFVVRKYRTLTSFRQALPLLFLVGWLLLILACAIGLLPWSVALVSAGTYITVVMAANLGRDGLGGQRAGTLWARSWATVCIHFAWPVGFFAFLMSPPMHKRIARWL